MNNTPKSPLEAWNRMTEQEQKDAQKRLEQSGLLKPTGSDYKLVDVEGAKRELLQYRQGAQDTDDSTLFGAMSTAIKVIDAHTVEEEWIRLEDCDWSDHEWVWFYEDDGEPPYPRQHYLHHLRDDASSDGCPQIMVARRLPDIHPPLPDSPEQEEGDE